MCFSIAYLVARSILDCCTDRVGWFSACSTYCFRLSVDLALTEVPDIDALGCPICTVQASNPAGLAELRDGWLG
jgi:hypothetical protein